MKNLALQATCRFLCVALLTCAFGHVSVGKASGQLWRPQSNDAVEDTVQEQRWRERMDRQTTTPSQPPAATPSAQKPDLSGLPKQLPQGGPTMPEPINALPDRTRVRRDFESIGTEKQGLIKPKIGKASDREEKPRTSKRHIEPLRNPMPAVSPSNTVRTQAGRQDVRQPAPVPVPQQATATPSRRVAPKARPQETPDHPTGLIKPRIFGSKSEKRHSTVKAAVKRQSKHSGDGQIPDAQKPAPRKDSTSFGPAVHTKAPAEARQNNTP